MSSVNATTHADTQGEALCSRKCFSPRTASSHYAPGQTSPIFSLPLCPPQLRVFAAKILHAGWHNVSVPLPPSPECSVFRYRRAVGVKSQNPLELPGALNTAECRQSRLPHTHGVEMALCRGHLIREELAGSRGIFGEELSCIAQ